MNSVLSLSLSLRQFLSKDQKGFHKKGIGRILTRAARHCCEKNLKIKRFGLFMDTHFADILFVVLDALLRGKATFRQRLALETFDLT